MASSSDQQLIHSVNAKDNMSMLILEAVKYQQGKYSDKAVSSQEIVAYIESEASNDGVECDHDEISLILSSMAGEDGPLAQIVESDNSVIKFRLTMDKPWDTEGNSRTPSPLQQENQSTSSGTDNSEQQEENESEEDIACGPPGPFLSRPCLADGSDISEVQKGAEPRRPTDTRCPNKVSHTAMKPLNLLIANDVIFN